MEKTRYDKEKNFYFLILKTNEFGFFFLGADISDYFNYGFTEETWAQYCDRQRRLRSENNLARLNPTHVKFQTILL